MVSWLHVYLTSPLEGSGQLHHYPAPLPKSKVIHKTRGRVGRKGGERFGEEKYLFFLQGLFGSSVARTQTNHYTD